MKKLLILLNFDVIFTFPSFKNTQFQKELQRQAQRVNEILIYFLKTLHLTLGYKGGLNQFYTMYAAKRNRKPLKIKFL